MVASRSLKLLAVVAIGGAVVVAAFIVLVLVGFEACDGEVGVANDSPAGRFCSSPVVDGWIIIPLQVGAVVVTLLVGASLRRRDWRRAAVAAAGGLGVLVLLSGAAIALPNDCSNADQRAPSECGAWVWPAALETTPLAAVLAVARLLLTRTDVGGLWRVASDTGQKPVSSCQRLSEDATRSGVCERDGRRLIFGAREDAVRVGATQLEVEDVETDDVLPGDEEIPPNTADGTWLVVELKVTGADATSPVELSEVKAFGNRLRTLDRIVPVDNLASTQAGYGTDTYYGNEIPAGESQSVLLAYDLADDVLESVLVHGAAIEFVDGRLVNFKRRRNQVADQRHAGVVRVPPLLGLGR